MGSWNITIKGVGSHHNGVNKETGEPSCPEDANLMAGEFLKSLQDKGHSIEVATFTQTGHDKVDDLLANNTFSGV